MLYAGLPAQLRQELDNPRRKRPLPRWVLFGSACDPFIGGPAVVTVTRDCLEILLRREIGVSITTRGWIPEEVIALLSRHEALVQLTIPLVSLSDQYHLDWEPGTAAPRERLFLLQQLQRAGLEPAVRIEPVIPFVNDSTSDLRLLLSALEGIGIQRASAGFLHLRPGVAEQLQAEAPSGSRRLVLGAFPSLRSPRPASFHHLDLKPATAALRRLQRIAREHSARVTACRCQNPGLPSGLCPIEPANLPVLSRGEQTEFFPEDDD